MTALPSIEYPYWLMIAGVFLLTLGLIGLSVRRRLGVEAESPATESDQESPESADLNDVEVYNRSAKEKRRDRWADKAVVAAIPDAREG